MAQCIIFILSLLALAQCLMAQGQDDKALRHSQVCGQPKVTGPCRAAHRRQYFNPATQNCEPFIYGGCDGNDNNFPYDEECIRVCKDKRQCAIAALAPPAEGCRYDFSPGRDGCPKYTQICGGIN